MKHELKHVVRKTSWNSAIVVLDTDGEITQEDAAMICALYSRDPGSIFEKLREVQTRGSGNFMGTFYVGYGHQSIGDNAYIHVFIEDVSMLAAKAIQDFPLYAGQEVSTRYVPWESTLFINPLFISPLGNGKSQVILDGWRNFYTSQKNNLIPHLKERYPQEEDQSNKAYTKAIEARAFDIMRGFLPAGASTRVAWTGDVRSFQDRLPYLKQHPLEEVRSIGTALHEALFAAHPNSFKNPEKTYPETDTYIREWSAQAYYQHNPNCPEHATIDFDGLDRSNLESHFYALNKRPNRFTTMPYRVRELGIMRLTFLLDFGGYRDLQRHRALEQCMPLLTSELGLEPWYLEQFPEKLREGVLKFIDEQVARIRNLAVSPETAQYFLPMGFRCTQRITGDLRGLVYMAELRSQSDVHFTLRHRAKEIASLLETSVPGLVLHHDRSNIDFDIVRGEQDIVRIKT